MICLFLILLTSLNVYAALTGVYGAGRARYGILVVCTLLTVGILGLLRMTKWGWALIAAGCLAMGTGYLYYFSKVHQGALLVQGLLSLVFFLYLVRPEVRERLR